MEIVYTEHLKLRMKVREIPFDYPKKILEFPDKLFFDVLGGRKIAIKKLKYGGVFKNIMIAYDVCSDRIEIVTVHPISDEKILNRIISGRWK